MLTKNNWAFFISKNEVAWNFGQDNGPTFKDSLLRLTKALQSFGEEFLGDAIGTLTIGDINNTDVDPLTILFIRLSHDMYLVISQPSTTALLLELVEGFQMPEMLRDQARGVLVGAALSTYSKFWGSELYEKLQPQIDDIFARSIAMIGAENRAVVGDGTCSLAELTMPELILFHHYLQKSLQNRPEFQSLQEWCLIADLAGAPIHLIWNLEEQFATSLAGLLCVIHTFTTTFFGYKPLEMTFGISNVLKLSFFSGKNVFCTMAQPRSLLKRPSFNQALLQVKDRVLDDIQPEIRSFIEKEIASDFAANLRTRDFPSLLSQFSADISENVEQPIASSIDQLHQVRSFTQEILKSIESSSFTIDKKEPYQILVMGATERIKRLFKEQFIIMNAKTLTVDEFTFDMLEVEREFNHMRVSFQFWFISSQHLDSLKFYVLSSIIFNPHCLIVPYSFKDKKWLPPITRYIENFWNHSGRSSVSTIILLLEGNEDHIYYKEAYAHYSRLRKSIKQPERIQFLPILNPRKESLVDLLELIVALKKLEEKH